MKGLLGKLFLCGAVLYTQTGLAIETARVLPKNVFRARLATVVTGSITDTFNSRGRLEPITSGLNQSVGVDTLAASEPALGQLRDALNALSPGMGDDLMGANIYSDFEANVQQFVPAIEYGATSRLSVGIRVPVVQRDIQTSFNVAGVNNAAAISQMMGTLSPALTGGLQQASGTTLNTQFFENALFRSKGYQSPNGRISGTELGDIEVGGAYNYYKGDKYYATALLGLRMPTGSVGELENFFDTGVGKGSYTLGFHFFEEYKPSEKILISAAQKIEYSFADTRRRAVPLNEGDAIPSILESDGQVQDVTRQRGVYFFGELAATGIFYEKALHFWAAAQYATEGKASFSGPGNLYYEGLANNTYFHSLGGEVGFKYSALAAYVAKKVSVPYEVSVQYNRVLDGNNVSMSSYGRMDMIVYF